MVKNMMILFTITGARFACEPEEILGVLETLPASTEFEKRVTGKEPQPYCQILVGNQTVPIALTFDAMLVAISEYIEERDYGFSAEQEPGSTTDTLGDAEHNPATVKPTR